MKIIALISHVDGKLVYINIDTIGHIYDVVKTEKYKEDEVFTTVGTTTHNNGGFRVKENAKTILKMISDEPYLMIPEVALLKSLWSIDEWGFDIVELERSEEEPEYDGAGFSEEDRIVNGQYRVIDNKDNNNDDILWDTQTR
jgi:hypothetical protein